MRPNMEDNYEMLDKRVLDALSKTDLLGIKDMLERIKGETLCVGVGGSKVVSEFASKVLNMKNGVVTEAIEPRDMLYKNLSSYKNVLVSSFSGNNYGVDVAFNNDLSKYLLSSGVRDHVNNLTYHLGIEKEDSFISLAATLVPMSILMAYYVDNDLDLIREILKSRREYSISRNEVYEIFSGYDTKTASTFLESTMVEGGIGIPVVHEKYGYCHGRSTLAKDGSHSAVILNGDTGLDLDCIFNKELQNYYKEIIELNGKYGDQVIDDFYLTYQAMWLARSIALSKNKDLSRVDYLPLVKKLYHFRGSM